MENIYTRLGALLDDAIALNAARRQMLAPQLVDFLSGDEYLREHGTVRLDIGRLSGKTKLIVERADADSFVLVYSDDVKDRFKGSPATVMTPDELLFKIYNPNFSVKDRRYSICYVDEPTFTLDSDPKRVAWLYNVLHALGVTTIVLLGM